MNKFFGYALVVTIFSVGTSWASFVNSPSSSGGGYRGSSWSSNSGSWGGGGGGHK